MIIIAYLKPINPFGFPIAFALMSRKTVRAYNSLFKRLLEIKPQWTPYTIIVDFERASMVSLKTIFKNVSIRECWFHSSPALWRKVGEFEPNADVLSVNGVIWRTNVLEVSHQHLRTHKATPSQFIIEIFTFNYCKVSYERDIERKVSIKVDISDLRKNHENCDMSRYRKKISNRINILIWVSKKNVFRYGFELQISDILIWRTATSFVVHYPIQRFVRVTVSSSDKPNMTIQFAPKLLDTSPPISIHLQLPDNTYINYIVRIKSPLEELMTSYRESYEIPESNVRFQYNGVPISGTDTPLSLKMEAGHVIEAIHINI
ncbi:hypothetical protein ACI65C_006699 [Semiaphis heraclei]